MEKCPGVFWLVGDKEKLKPEEDRGTALTNRRTFTTADVNQQTSAIHRVGYNRGDKEAIGKLSLHRLRYHLSWDGQPDATGLADRVAAHQAVSVMLAACYIQNEVLGCPVGARKLSVSTPRSTNTAVIS